MTDHAMTWQPTPAARSREGLRASVGDARRFRIRDGIRAVVGYGRGGVVPMGIVLKEGET